MSKKPVRRARVVAMAPLWSNPGATEHRRVGFDVNATYFSYLPWYVPLMMTERGSRSLVASPES
jgi:hypothetical protein